MTRRVLITGAAGGVGRVLAERLLARGDQVIACARRTDQLTALTGAVPLAMDVSRDESVAGAFAVLKGGLDAVIHCAAVAPLGTVEFTPPARVAEVLNTNTLGSLRVLQGALPHLRQSKGRLILVSSLWGRVSGPFVSSYAASKHAVEALADSARRETRGQGVHISVVEPGVILTPMYANQATDLDAAIAALGVEETRVYGSLYQDHRKLLPAAGKGAITPEACCKVIETCLDSPRPRPRYTAGKDARLLVTLGRLLSDRGLDRVFATQYPGKA